MNISKLQGSIEKGFEFEFLDFEGKPQKEKVTLHIKRINLRKALAKEFQDLFKKADENQEKIAEFVCDTLDGWDLTADDAGTPLAISVDNYLDVLDYSLATRIGEEVAAALFPNFQKANP